MVDKELEKKIKQIKEFMELWVKFHELYKSATKNRVISPDEEKAFLETKSLIARKYQALMDNLNIEPTAEDKTMDIISQVLSLETVSSISDMQMRKIENDWHDSYISLNKLLGKLENKREDFAKMRTGKIMMKRILFNPVSSLIFVVIVIILIYLMAVRFFNMNEMIGKRQAGGLTQEEQKK